MTAPMKRYTVHDLPRTEVPRAEAEVLLERVSMSNLTCHEHSRGIAWRALLTLDGNTIAHVEQQGNGGCNTYDTADPALLGRVHAAAALLLAEHAGTEALDSMTATMEDGMDGLQACAAYVAYEKSFSA